MKKHVDCCSETTSAMQSGRGKERGARAKRKDKQEKGQNDNCKRRKEGRGSLRSSVGSTGKITVMYFILNKRDFDIIKVKYTTSIKI